MRKAAATARAMLVTAAARRWGVSAGACRAEAGLVVHTPSGRKLAYGQLVSAAARLPVPADVPLKAPGDFRLIGKATHRVDTLHKVDGQARYGIDFQMPGHAAGGHRRVPRFRRQAGQGRRVEGALDQRRSQGGAAGGRRRRGGRPHGSRRQGLAALQIEWLEGANAHLSTQDLADDLVTAIKAKGLVQTNKGSFDEALKADGAQRIDYTFESPLLAHARWNR